MRRFSILILISLVFASCGDVSEHRAADSTHDLGSPSLSKSPELSEADGLTMNAAEESSDEEFAAAITSKSADPVQANRKTIANASIKLQTDALEKDIIHLKEDINRSEGHVYQYKIDKETYRQERIPQKNDSVLVVKEIIPTATLSVRVPTKSADSFVYQMLNYGERITQFYLNEEDITESLFESQAIATVYDKSSKTHKRKNSVNNVQFDNNNSIESIRQKVASARMTHKTKYLWFEIELEGSKQFSKRMIAGDEIFHTPTSVRLQTSLKNGWYALSEVVFALLNLWPLLILGLISLFLYRRYRPNIR